MRSIENRAIVTATLAAGSVESPYYVQANLSQRLCCATCADDTPVFAPAFTYVGISNVGPDQYVVTVHVEGVISYIPCGGDSCRTKSEMVSQDFTIPIYSATAPTGVTIEAGATVNRVVPVGCQRCSRDFVSETPLAITVA